MSLSSPEPSSPEQIFGRARALAALAGVYALCGGLVTLAGWQWDIARLTDWGGWGISMFPNAAVCAAASGLALLIDALGRRSLHGRTAIRLLGIFTAGIGGLTLFEHLTGINLGIDTALFHREWGQAVSMAPMRIGVPASVSFLCLGVGVFLLGGGPAGRTFSVWAASIPMAVASLSLVGYLFGANQLFGIARYTGIAWQTGSIIAVLGVGIMAANPGAGLMEVLLRRDAGGMVARRLIIPVILLPLLLGWLRNAGEDGGLFDAAFGTSVRTLAEIGLFLALVWWTANAISRHSRAVRQAEGALHSSEERFTRFMQSHPGLAWIKDLEGRYVFLNDAAEKAFGKPRAALYGSRDTEIFPAETAAQFMTNDRRALESPGGRQFVEKLAQDGEIRSSLVSKFPIPGPDGAVQFVGGLAIDITDRVRAEDALREADRRKEEFIAILAHELRNPLAPIRLAVHLARIQSGTDPRLSEAVDVIERQVRQMVRLLDDLLDVSRISHGKLELRPEVVDLRDVLRSALETSRPLFENRRFVAPPDDEPVFVRADPVRLAQVFSNLLNNAARFTADRGTIGIFVTGSADAVTVTVEDDGIGIDREALPRIFEIFAQAGGKAHPGGGLGIGLSLVRGIVELHGGKVAVRSEGPGRGCAFEVTLSRCAPDAPAPAADPIRPSERSSLRILVADDLRDSADSLALFLRSAGHVVMTAYDGNEALRAAEAERPDLILLDVGMPEPDGLEVCRRLRAVPWGKSVSIVAVTGWGQKSDRDRTAEAGFDRHLVKPVDPAALGVLIEQLAVTRRPG